MAQIIWLSPVANTTLTFTSNTAVDQYFVARTVEGFPVQSYSRVAGSVPPGLTLNLEASRESGDYAVQISGRLANVTAPTEYRIVLRAQDEQDHIDATYNFQIQPLSPFWDTASGNIANILSGNSQANSTSNTAVALQYTEPTPEANVNVKLSAGELPPGLEIGSGNITLNSPGSPISVDIQGVPYYQQGYANVSSQDFEANGNSFVKTWEFTLDIDDSFYTVSSNYAINIYAREFLNASSDYTLDTLPPDKVAILSADIDSSDPGYPRNYPPADYTFPDDFQLDASASSRYAPWLTLDSGNIGQPIENRYFARYIPSINLEPDAGTRYLLSDTNPDGSSSLLPQGLTLDPVTGYIYGRVMESQQKEFTFTISVADSDYPEYASRGITYRLNIPANLLTSVQWVTPRFLGTINNGDVSELYVQAESIIGADLYYEHTNGNLPPGLKLSDSGLIIGRVSFDTPNADTTYRFTVSARSIADDQELTETFSITVRHSNPEPYNNLYLQAFTQGAGKSLIDNILQDYVRIPTDIIYRLGDPNFGLNRRCKFLHAWNLKVVTDDVYAAAMQLNHYRRRLKLGEFRSAEARDAQGEIIYEVIYCTIEDDLENPSTGASVPISVRLDYPIDEGGSVISRVYPNSLDNMRTRIINGVGQVKPDLPRWMSSVQTDKTVLGYIPAWVIGYILPGYGVTVAYQMNQAWRDQLETIDFDIDRYVLDDSATYRYDPSAESWSAPVPLGGVVQYRTGNILVSEVDPWSTVSSLRPGDTVTWSPTSQYTTTVLGGSGWTPFLGGFSGDPRDPPNLTLNITNAGNGYSRDYPPAVRISDPVLSDGRRATAVTEVATNGSIANVMLIDTGLGYYQTPRVTIDLPPDGNVSNRAQATGTVVISPIVGHGGNSGSGYPNVAVATLTVQAPDYNALTPDITPDQARASFTVSGLFGNGGLQVQIADRGQNYQSAPYVFASSPNIAGNQGNRANLYATIYYQTAVGNAAPWDGNITARDAQLYLVNRYTTTDELDKYYLFPQVNILQ